MPSPNVVANKLRQMATQDRRVAMQRVVLVGERFAKEESPVKQGTLRRSITSRVSENGNRGTIGTNVKHAPAVHEGTRPHQIKPVRKKALMWKGAGHPVRVVNHPGTRPNPFFKRAASRLTSVAAREYLAGWNL